MNDYPLVSVVIPTYNYALYLPRAIESVLAQTYRQFELIIVDDGSTDNTAAVVESFRVKSPDRIRYIQQRNSGPNAARNKGLDVAKGEFIALLDADDEWLPEKLEKQVACALTNPQIGVIGCGAFAISDDGTILAENQCEPPPPREELIRHLMIRNFHFGGCSGVLIRRECFSVVGKFDESLRGSEDRDMWLRIAHNFDFMNLSDALFKFHFHQSNCHMNYSVMLNSRLKFIEKHFLHEKYIFKQKAISYAFLDAARESYRALKFFIAFYYSLQSIFCFPLKSTPDDDKYQILIKTILPDWLLSKARSKHNMQGSKKG